MNITTYLVNHRYEKYHCYRAVEFEVTMVTVVKCFATELEQNPQIEVGRHSSHSRERLEHGGDK